MENLSFDGTIGLKSVLKLEMTSYSHNAYDITYIFGCFAKFLAYNLFLPSFIVVRHQMAELNRGEEPFPPSIIGLSRTPSKTVEKVNVGILMYPYGDCGEGRDLMYPYGP